MKTKALLTCSALSLLLASTSAAFAQDQRSYDWSGLALTLYGGSTKAITRATDVEGEEYFDNTAGSSLTLKDNSGYIGLTASYSLQQGNFVYGAEMELGRLSNKALGFGEDHDDGIFASFGPYMSITARLGYAHGPSLFYAKAGPAWAKIRTAGGEFKGYGREEDGGKWGFNGSEAGFGEETRSGYTFGFGVERAISQKITVKAEYMISDFGTVRYGNVDGNMSEPFDFKNRIQQAKIGLSYRF